MSVIINGDTGINKIQDFTIIESPVFTGTVVGVTKTMVGLSNVDNTTDVNKPVSSATQTALGLKADTSTVNSQVWAHSQMPVGSVLQVVTGTLPPMYLSVPAYGNDKNNFRQFGSISTVITTKSTNSKIAIMISSTIHSTDGSHTYFDIKRNGTWISGYDGVYADHHQGGYGYGMGINFIDTPNVPAGTTLTYTYWGGNWGATQLGLNAYGNDINNRNGDQDGRISIWEIK